MVAVMEAMIGICQQVFWSGTCTKMAGIHKGFQSSTKMAACCVGQGYGLFFLFFGSLSKSLWLAFLHTMV